MNIEKYSNPEIVQANAYRYLGNVPVFYSTRKNKKYMVKNPQDKWVHFGEMGYIDYTRSRNKDKRDAFKIRNAKWANAPKWSPAWLSYHLLW